MRKTGRWIASIISKTLVVILVIILLPFARTFLRSFLPDATGEIRVQSVILKQKLESSKRLEVTTIDEEGVLEAKTNVIIFGTVGSTTIRYRYTASIGIDLSKVVMTTDSDRIIFALPDPEILNDGIEALEINKNNLFSKAIEKSVETLLNEQKAKCREQYVTEKEHADRAWEDIRKSFEETICQWLENYGERHYQFEFVRLNDTAADASAAFFMRKCRRGVGLFALTEF
ncbi:MAG: DUF4230 domain-containing protein [Clostridia bacterium]|nr:DUF4230 domain-containing protein [Clostridia bacterium]